MCKGNNVDKTWVGCFLSTSGQQIFRWFIWSLLNPWLWLLEMLQKIFRTLVDLLFLSFLVCFPWPFKSFLASFWPKQERLLHDLGEGPGEFATPESPDCSMEGSPRSVNHQGKILDFVKKEGLLSMLRICFLWFWLKLVGTLKKWTHISTVHISYKVHMPNIFPNFCCSHPFSHDSPHFWDPHFWWVDFPMLLKVLVFGVVIGLTDSQHGSIADRWRGGEL